MMKRTVLVITLSFSNIEAFHTTLHHRSTRSSHMKLFGTKTSTTNSKKSRGAKLYFQNPKDVDFWIEDNELAMPQTQVNKIKLKELAYEGQCLVHEMRRVALLINEEGNQSDNHDNYDKLKENYAIAMDNAKNADLKYGLCSQESLNAWDLVDEARIELKHFEANEKKSSNKLNDELKAFQLLETSFMEIQNKIN